MNEYQIFDAKESRLLKDWIIISAKRPVDALNEYLKGIGENVTVKVSAERNVRFGVIPCITENGRVYQLYGKRRTWFKTIKEVAP